MDKNPQGIETTTQPPSTADLAPGEVSLEQRNDSLKGLSSLKSPKKKGGMIHVFRKFSILLFVLTLLSFVWFTVDLDPQNEFLSSVSIENLGSRFERQNQKKFILDTELVNTVSRIEVFQEKIKNEKFLEYQEEVDDIRSDQLVWFDKEVEGEYLFGMIDVFDSIADFFNDRRYSDPEKIVSGRSDQVKIQDVSVDRNGARVSVSVSQILGRVFFLTNEFVDVINSIPFYTGAENIKSFAREKNELGDDSMSFSLSLERQENPKNEFQIPHPEIDPADERFFEFLEWFRNTK